MAEEGAFLGSHICALLVALAEMDAYTEEHTRRVALRAVRVAEELGLAPSASVTLRSKVTPPHRQLTTPDAIMKKPGPAHRRRVSDRDGSRPHGRGAAEELGGFSPMVQRLVRGHHERLDGSGYRARQAWTHERALEHLRDGADRLFYGVCVDALARVLERESARDAELALAV